MTGLALAVLLATAPAVGGRLPGAPLELFRVSWQRDLSSKVMGEWQPIELGGASYDSTTRLVVVGTRDGVLHAVRPDGSLAWEFQGEGAFAAEPLIAGDTVYAGSNGGRLYALALQTGLEAWHYDAQEQLGTRPALEGGTVFVATLSDNVIAVDAKTGTWKWHHRREPREGFTIRGAASVVLGGGLVFAGYSDGTVSALDVRTGAVRWERQVAPSGDYQDVDALVLSGNVLYAAAYSGAVVALDAATGKPRWQYAGKDMSRLVEVPGLLVAVSAESIQALSPVDGRVVWTASMVGTPSGQPCAVGKWLLVPAGDGGLRMLELATGRLLRVLDPGSGVSSTPAVGAGLVYILSNGGRLLALQPR
jgi:outer membrane protein assembly factor BamB